MSEPSISKDTIAALAAKLDGLELTGGEQQALDAVLYRAAEGDAEVEGFGVVFEVETTYLEPDADYYAKGERPPTELKLAAGLGLFPSRNVWTDMRPLS